MQTLPREDLGHIFKMEGITSTFDPETREMLFQAPGYPDVRVNVPKDQTFGTFFDFEIKTLKEAWKKND